MAALDNFQYAFGMDAGRERQSERGFTDRQERRRSDSPPRDKDSRRSDNSGNGTWAPPSSSPQQASTYPSYSYSQGASYGWESHSRGYALPEPARSSSDVPSFLGSSTHHQAQSAPAAYSESSFPPRYSRPSFPPYSTASLPALSSHLPSRPSPTFSSSLPPFALHPLQQHPQQEPPQPHPRFSPHLTHDSSIQPPSQALPVDWAIIANHGRADEQAGHDSRPHSWNADPRERQDPRDGESKWQWASSSSSSHAWNNGVVSNGQAWDPVPRHSDVGLSNWSGASMGSLQAISRAASHAASGEQYRSSEGSNGSHSRGSYGPQDGYEYGTGGSKSGSMGRGEKKARKPRRRNGQPPRDLALRRYACELCIEEPRSFARPSALKIHMLTHTKEKPHICPVCSRAFAISSNLKRHQKLHDAEEAAAAERKAERWATPKGEEAW